MLLSVHDLQIRPLDFDETYQRGQIACAHPGLESFGPMHVTGQARLLGPQIRVRMQMEGSIQPCCARCLEVVPLTINNEYELVYHPSSQLTNEQEVEIHTADTEVGFFRGEGIELEDIVCEQVLLALPLRTVCSENCRGLCPQCGQNLNQGECGCAAQPGDSRWAALAALKHKVRPEPLK